MDGKGLILAYGNKNHPSIINMSNRQQKYKFHVNMERMLTKFPCCVNYIKKQAHTKKMND